MAKRFIKRCGNLFVVMIVKSGNACLFPLKEEEESIEDLYIHNNETMTFLNIPDELKGVRYLPQLLLRVRVWHSRNFEKAADLGVYGGVFYTAAHLAKDWRAMFVTKYGEDKGPYTLSSLSTSYLSMILRKFGRKKTEKVFDAVFKDWEAVCEAARNFGKNVPFFPEYPEPIFIYRYFSAIMQGFGTQDYLAIKK